MRCVKEEPAVCSTCNPKTRQGVLNLNLIKVVRPVLPCARSREGKPGDPCTPSKWKKDFVYPNAYFDTDDYTDPLQVNVEVRVCLSCGREMQRKNYGNKFFGEV